MFALNGFLWHWWSGAFCFFFKFCLFKLYIQLPHSKGFAKCYGGCVWAKWPLSINSSYTHSVWWLNFAEMNPSLLSTLIQMICRVSLMFTRWCHLIIEYLLLNNSLLHTKISSSAFLQRTMSLQSHTQSHKGSQDVLHNSKSTNIVFMYSSPLHLCVLKGGCSHYLAKRTEQYSFLCRNYNSTYCLINHALQTAGLRHRSASSP